MAGTAGMGLATWLQQLNLSLAFTTYRANRLFLLGTGDSGNLKLHQRLFDRPMGLFLSGNSLWMATRSQIWRLDNHLSENEIYEGGDRLYVPSMSVITGDVDSHELIVTTSGTPIFVNTSFSCLATIGSSCSFNPVWKPSFISELCCDDSCHLNGVALLDGLPTWVSTCGLSPEPASWRLNRDGGGALIHIPTGDLTITGLSMPHSPRFHEGRLWLLNSGTAELGWVENGRFISICTFQGFPRGLAMIDHYAVVGISKLRAPQLLGLPLQDRLIADGVPSGFCGLRVVDILSGDVIQSLDLPDPIDELFDVVILPGARRPRAIGLHDDEIHNLIKLPGKKCELKSDSSAREGDIGV